jgi:hypothetical protein
MYLYARNETGGMRHQASQQPYMMTPQEMRHAMAPYGMQAGIAGKHLDRAARRRVLGEYGL